MFRSWMRKRNGEVSDRATKVRACWATQEASGFEVTPARCTLRVTIPMNKRAYTRRRNTVRRRRSRRRRCQPPGLSGFPSRRGPCASALDALLPKDRPYGAGPNRDPEVLELALDAPIAPGLILPRRGGPRGGGEGCIYSISPGDQAT